MLEEQGPKGADKKTPAWRYKREGRFRQNWSIFMGVIRIIQNMGVGDMSAAALDEWREQHGISLPKLGEWGSSMGKDRLEEVVKLWNSQRLGTPPTIKNKKEAKRESKRQAKANQQEQTAQGQGGPAAPSTVPVARALLPQLQQQAAPSLGAAPSPRALLQSAPSPATAAAAALGAAPGPHATQLTSPVKSLLRATNPVEEHVLQLLATNQNTQLGQLVQMYDAYKQAAMAVGARLKGDLQAGALVASGAVVPSRISNSASQPAQPEKVQKAPKDGCRLFMAEAPECKGKNARDTTELWKALATDVKAQWNAEHKKRKAAGWAGGWGQNKRVCAG